MLSLENQKLAIENQWRDSLKNLQPKIEGDVRQILQSRGSIPRSVEYAEVVTQKIINFAMELFGAAYRRSGPHLKLEDRRYESTKFERIIVQHESFEFVKGIFLKYFDMHLLMSGRKDTSLASDYWFQNILRPGVYSSTLIDFTWTPKNSILFPNPDGQKPAIQFTPLSPQIRLDKMEEFRQRGVLADMWIIAGNLELPCHRVVLACHCKVLEKMLSSEFRESRNHRWVVEDEDPVIVELFVKLVYTGHVDLSQFDNPLDAALHLAKFALRYQTDCVDGWIISVLEDVVYKKYVTQTHLEELFKMAISEMNEQLTLYCLIDFCLNPKIYQSFLVRAFTINNIDWIEGIATKHKLDAILAIVKGARDFNPELQK